MVRRARYKQLIPEHRLIAAIVEQAKRDLKQKNVSEFDKQTARQFLITLGINLEDAE